MIAKGWRMDTAVANVTPWRFSTDALPDRERGAALDALYGRNTISAFEALPDAPVYADFMQWRLPGLVLFTAAVEAVRSERTHRHLADGVAELCLSVNLSGGRKLSFGRGRELILHAGESVLWSCAEPFASIPLGRDRGRGFTLRLPRAALAPLVTNIDDAVLRLIPRGTGALKLMASYVGMLGDDEALATPELRRLVVTQLYDLVALAIGATRDAVAIAEGRGVRAARLRAIKADIDEHLADDLTVAAVAFRQRISESYVRKLFESEGSSFSECVLGERLIRAHRMLTDPRFAGRSITSVAFDAGFSDVSYFNRSFRRRFGGTPSGIRAEAKYRQ
jgi:AraC-like DNA-binding protein